MAQVQPGEYSPPPTAPPSAFIPKPGHEPKTRRQHWTPVVLVALVVLVLGVWAYQRFQPARIGILTREPTTGAVEVYLMVLDSWDNNMASDGVATLTVQTSTHKQVYSHTTSVYRSTFQLETYNSTKARTMARVGSVFYDEMGVTQFRDNYTFTLRFKPTNGDEMTVDVSMELHN